MEIVYKKNFFLNKILFKKMLKKKSGKNSITLTLKKLVFSEKTMALYFKV